MPFDSATSALLGAVIGGVIGVIGTAIAAWATSSRERTAFVRTRSLQHTDLVRETYAFALNVFFNLDTGGMPDRATSGKMYADISLHGSPLVREILLTYLAAKPQERTIDMTRLREAMRAHLAELDGVRI